MLRSFTLSFIYSFLCLAILLYLMIDKEGAELMQWVTGLYAIPAYGVLVYMVDRILCKREKPLWVSASFVALAIIATISMHSFSSAIVMMVA